MALAGPPGFGGRRAGGSTGQREPSPPSGPWRKPLNAPELNGWGEPRTGGGVAGPRAREAAQALHSGRKDHAPRLGSDRRPLGLL
jgi:hypothetical protein